MNCISSMSFADCERPVQHLAHKNAFVDHMLQMLCCMRRACALLFFPRLRLVNFPIRTGWHMLAGSTRRCGPASLQLTTCSLEAGPARKKCSASSLIIHRTARAARIAASPADAACGGRPRMSSTRKSCIRTSSRSPWKFPAPPACALAPAQAPLTRRPCRTTSSERISSHLSCRESPRPSSQSRGDVPLALLSALLSRERRPRLDDVPPCALEARSHCSLANLPADPRCRRHLACARPCPYFCAPSRVLISSASRSPCR